MKKVFLVIIALFIGMAVPYGISKSITEWILRLTASEEYVIGVFVHRVTQSIIALLLIRLVYSKPDMKALFSFGSVKAGLKRFKAVFLLWPILTFVFFASAMVLIPDFEAYLSALYPHEAQWFLTRVSRDLFLVDAIPEELLYRAFIMGLLMTAIKYEFKRGKYKLSLAAVLSVPIFSAAHVQVSFFPLMIIQYDVVQLVLTLFTGLLFAYAFERTKSLITPIILHGYTNLVITLCAYAFNNFFVW